MKKLVLILVCFLFFACDNETSNNNENNSIVGIWKKSEPSRDFIFVFNKDGTGQLLEYRENLIWSNRDLVWEIDDNNYLCMTLSTINEEESEHCDEFDIRENYLYYKSSKYERISELP